MISPVNSDTRLFMKYSLIYIEIYRDKLIRFGTITYLERETVHTRFTVF